MSIPSEMERDHREAEADWGSKVITWNGEDYDCVAGGIDTDIQIMTGGNPVDASSWFMCRVSVFPSSIPPATGDLITFEDVEYRVASVRNIQNTLVRINVVDPDV